MILFCLYVIQLSYFYRILNLKLKFSTKSIPLDPKSPIQLEWFSHLRNCSIASQTPGCFLNSQSRGTIGNAHNSTPNMELRVDMIKKWAWCVTQENKGHNKTMNDFAATAKGKEHLPFGETGTLLIVCSWARGKTIQTLAPWLIVGASKRNQTLLSQAHKPWFKSTYTAIHADSKPLF